MQTKTVNRYIRLSAGCLLIVFGGWGLAHGLRATVAQAMYFDVRHAGDPVTPDDVLSAAERAAQWYAGNFYLPYLAADRALDAAWRAETAEKGERYLRAAAYWCGQGLRLNPYRSEIRLTQTRLLEAEGDLDAAIAHWRAFVETEYWNPDHHAVLAELYLQAGQLEAAEHSLQLARRSRQHRDLAQQLQSLRQPVSRR